jgi:hypothetical protein
MLKAYIAISGIIFALVAILHLVRIVQGWQVQLADIGVAMSVSWIALVVSASLALWGELCCCGGERGLLAVENQHEELCLLGAGCSPLPG